ncbi:MAG: DUF2927 domain-containing protein [Pseudomonadota bacterium]
MPVSRVFAALRCALVGIFGVSAGIATADPLSTPLGSYYQNLEARLVGEGRLRQDRASHATGADGLAASFMAIAMRSEYRLSGSGMIRSGSTAPLRRWEQPVRISVRFGPSVPAPQQASDRGIVADVAGRLHRATGHSISTVGSNANFHILVLSDEERAGIAPLLRQLVPGISNAAVGAVRRMSRNTFCMVIAMPGADPAQGYLQAVAIVRAEHPPRMRRSCIEEEMAQGMGLANDSPDAWPSIFNDDEEFGVLTRHDELLLRLLYDRRLQAGMAARDVAAMLPALCAQLL